jgi:hypothetical protein
MDLSKGKEKMSKLTMILIFQLSWFLSQNMVGQSWNDDILTDGIIYTKTDTIKCFLPYSDTYTGTLKFKIRKDDQKYVKIKCSEISSLTRGAFKFRKIEYKGSGFLAKTLVEGKVSLFESHKPGALTANANGTYSSGNRETTDYYINEGTKVLKLTRSGFKTDLKSILTGDENTLKLIDELKYNDLMFKLPGIISQYNIKTKNL